MLPAYVEKAQAYHLERHPKSVTDIIATPSTSSAEGDKSCTQGTLRFDEPCNHPDYPEGRFFGVTSGRADLHWPDDRAEQINDDLCYDQQPELDETALATTESLPSTSLKEHLIDCYFEWEQPWCQVVDEQLFRDSERNGGRYSSPFLVNSILAMGSRYSDRMDIRQSPAHSNCAGQVFLARAEKMLNAELKRPTVTTVQALAILGIFYVAVGQDTVGWLHHGMSVQLALDIGINMDSTVLHGSDRLTPQELRLRHQVYWALYCDDKLWASYTGRVCLMLVSAGSRGYLRDGGPATPAW
ncbi:unnamed protein product, partial [Clonostachys byssicola]